MRANDITLLQRWQTQRDAEAFAEIVSRYSGIVYNTCKRILRNATDAEDTAQECFLELMNSSVMIRASLASWLHTIAYQRSLDRVKSDKRRHGREKAYVAEHDKQNHILVDDMIEYVDAAIEELPEKRRAALIRHFLEGESYESIAQDFGVAESTIRYRTNKAIERIRALLKRRGIPVSASALAAMLEQTTAEAAPATLTVSLAKLAVAGTTASVVSKSAATTAASTSLQTIGGIAIMSKKAFVGIAIILFALGLTYSSLSGRTPTSVVNAPSVANAPSSVLSEASESRVQAPNETLIDEGESVQPLDTSTPLIASEAPEEEEEEDESPPTEKTVTPTASISGYVFDNAGYTLEGASVFAEILVKNVLKRGYSVRTNADGRYEILDIDMFDGTAVYAAANEYIMQRRHVGLTPGKQYENINFTLQRAISFVAGHVVSEDKKPIAEASVDVMYYGYEEEGLAITAKTGGTTGTIGGKLLFATTDENGYFEIGIPDEGLCDFRVEKNGFGSGFFPQVATGTMDALFVLLSGGSIAGRVTKAKGKPVQETTVTITGEALPGGLAPSKVKIQPLPLSPKVVHTDANGDYVADGLGENYIYTVRAYNPEYKETEEAPEENGVREITNMIRTVTGNTDLSVAKRTGIRVKAGSTTGGIDFEFGSARSAMVYGKVTDRTTGLPAGTVTVSAMIAEPDNELEPHLGSGTVTYPDGSYSLSIKDLSDKQTFEIRILYMTEGGSAWSQPPEPVAVIELEPGDEEEVNFTVDAPIIVPVRYVGENGEPIQDVSAGIRQAGRGGACGGMLSSDADGRVTFHGIPPFVELKVIAWSSDYNTIGISNPFSGQPGETVPEVVVVCNSTGGIEGIVVDQDTNPVSDTEIKIQFSVRRFDNAIVNGARAANSDADGFFAALDAIPTGICERLLISCKASDPDNILIGSIENVEIMADSVSDVGVIVLEQVSLEPAMEMLRN